MNQLTRSLFAAASLSLIGGVANAQIVELQQNSSDYPSRVTGLYADTYYNGGYMGNTATSGALQGNAGYGPGPTLGFTLSTNAEVLLAGTSSTSGRFQNLPADAAPGDSNTQTLDFNNTFGNPMTNYINFAAGFTGVKFNYSLADNNSAYDQIAIIWSGLNGTGTELGTIALNSAATTDAPTSPQYHFTTWSSAADNSFSGVAESVTFGTSTVLANEELELDAFTVQEAPEPSSADLGLIAAGALLGLTVLRRRALRA